MLTPMILNWQTALILLIAAVLLFGGAKIAGLGKSAGRALREFKEETKDLTDNAKYEKNSAAEVVDAEVVEDSAVPAIQTTAPKSSTTTQAADSTVKPSDLR